MKTRKFDEILFEGKDEAKAIRSLLKDKFKLTSRDVSVKSKSGGYSSMIMVSIKTPKALAFISKIEDLSKDFEKFSRDEATYEILSGGNTFVHTSIDYDFKSKMKKMIQNEIEKQVTEKTFEISDSILLYKTINIYRESKNRFFISPKGGGSVTTVAVFDALSDGVMSFIGSQEDDSLYLKIK